MSARQHRIGALPTSDDSERVVIAACLVDPKLWPLALDVLRDPMAVGDPRHRLIVAAARELFAEGQPLDETTLWVRINALDGGTYSDSNGHELRVFPTVRDWGAYALPLMDGAVSLDAETVRKHAERLQRSSDRRRIALELERLGRAILDADDPSDELAQAHEFVSKEIKRVSTAPDPWSERSMSIPDSWYLVAPPRRTWLLIDNRSQSAGVLPAGKVGLVIASGGAGKTMALVQLAAAVATGGAWLGHYTVPTRGRVLLVLGEEDAEEVRRRAYAARRTSDTPPPDSIVTIPLAGFPCSMIQADERGNPIDAPFLHWLRTEIIKRGPFDLIIVDPLSRFAGLDAETDNAAATRFVQALESLATEFHATVLVAHHTNKDGRRDGAAVTGSSARGSSAIYDGVRWAAAISVEKIAGVDEHLSEVVTFAVVKSNYSRYGDPILLRRDTDGGALLPLDKIDQTMINAARQDSTPTNIRRVEKETAQARRMESIIAMAVQTVEAWPGITSRELRQTVRAKSQCGADLADLAITRALAEGTVVKRGQSPATHWLPDVHQTEINAKYVNGRHTHE